LKKAIDAMPLSAETEHIFQIIMIILALGLIPIVIGVVMILIKVSSLLECTTSLIRMLTYELGPLMKEVYLLVSHAEEIGFRASSGVQDVSEGVKKVGPLLKYSLASVQSNLSAFSRFALHQLKSAFK
jgi:uncharacterized protein YoxC